MSEKKSLLDRASSDDRVLCRLTFILLVLSMLGVDLPRALALVRGTPASASNATAVPIECFSNGECRAMFPVPTVDAPAPSPTP